MNDGPALPFDPELRLLQVFGSVPSTETTTNHTFKTAPVITGDAFEALGAQCIPQKAVYGALYSQHGVGAAALIRSPKVYINMNTPFSALVCGVQVRGAPFA